MEEVTSDCRLVCLSLRHVARVDIAHLWIKDIYCREIWRGALPIDNLRAKRGMLHPEPNWAISPCPLLIVLDLSDEQCRLLVLFGNETIPFEHGTFIRKLPFHRFFHLSGRNCLEDIEKRLVIS